MLFQLLIKIYRKILGLSIKKQGKTCRNFEIYSSIDGTGGGIRRPVGKVFRLVTTAALPKRGRLLSSGILKMQKALRQAAVPSFVSGKDWLSALKMQVDYDIMRITQ